jgi:hypothetical protein
LCSNYDKAKNLIMINYFLQSIDLEEILSWSRIINGAGSAASVERKWW